MQAEGAELTPDQWTLLQTQVADIIARSGGSGGDGAAVATAAAAVKTDRANGKHAAAQGVGAGAAIMGEA